MKDEPTWVDLADELEKIQAVQLRAEWFGYVGSEDYGKWLLTPGGHANTSALDRLPIWRSTSRRPGDGEDTLTGIREMLVDTPAGPRIPLGSVANIQEDRSPNFIMREGVQRRIVVQCNVVGRDLRSTVQEIEQRVGQALKLPQGYRIEYGGQFESLERAYQRLTLAGHRRHRRHFPDPWHCVRVIQRRADHYAQSAVGLGWRRGRRLPRRRRSFSRFHCWVYHAVWYGYAQRHY